MIDPQIFIGEFINFQKVCKIYPPTIREVLTCEEFGIFSKILMVTQEELREEARKNQNSQILTPFEFLLNCAYNNKELKKLIQFGFQFYTREPIVFLFEEKKILFGDFGKDVEKIGSSASLRYLTEENYFDFQNEIRAVNGLKKVNPPVPIDPNEDPRIRRIKEMAQKRDALKAKQGNKNGIHLSTSLVAICCMGIGITPLNIGELSYAAIGPIMNMMQEKEKYDIDIRSLLAGADSKKVKPKYWIRNHDND